MTIKYLSYASINSANPLYLIINKINGHITESNGNKYFKLVLTDRSKDTLKKYEELWNKIRDLTRSIISNSDDYDQKYIKIKLSSDDGSNDDLPLKNMLELYNMVIVVISVFHEGNKYYPQLFWMNVCINCKY